MNSCTIFFVVCLAFACAAAVPAPEAKPAAPQPATDGARNKRFFPAIAYSAPAVGTVSAYSYLAPYANSGKIVNYPAPVVSTYHAPIVSTYHAAVPAISTYSAAIPAISSYSAIPAISTYAASPLAAYHSIY